jgi:hypothetical protein
VGAALVGRVIDAKALTDGQLLFAIGVITTAICVFYVVTVWQRTSLRSSDSGPML